MQICWIEPLYCHPNDPADCLNPDSISTLPFKCWVFDNKGIYLGSVETLTQLSLILCTFYFQLQRGWDEFLLSANPYNADAFDWQFSRLNASSMLRPIFSVHFYTFSFNIFSWNQCLTTLTHSGTIVAGSPVSYLCGGVPFAFASSHFANVSTCWVSVRGYLRDFCADCYWVGDWFSRGFVILISRHVQSGGGGGGVDDDEGLLMSRQCGLNLLGLHGSCLGTNLCAIYWTCIV